MKSNLHTLYEEGITNIYQDWWVWKENCDRCGKLIFEKTPPHPEPGNKTELDFCDECLNYLMDNNILYKQAVILYSSCSEKG